ncbi:MAG: hypothetical protein GEU74_11395 [Nitriliruptorales bacterium]|nr:hypothetical protein [Nitriliruptorales bacterium]
MSTLQTPHAGWVRAHPLTIALIAALAVVAAVVLTLVLTAAPNSPSGIRTAAGAPAAGQSAERDTTNDLPNSGGSGLTGDRFAAPQ